jgi:hypothetical protein
MRSVTALGLSLFVCAASCVFAGDVLRTRCGHVDIPPLAQNDGVLCIGVCADDGAYHGCMGPAATARLEPSATPRHGIGQTRLLVRGTDIPVKGLAAALSQATGWRVAVEGEIQGLKLRPTRWKGAWRTLPRLRLKCTGGTQFRAPDML